MAKLDSITVDVKVVGFGGNAITCSILRMVAFLLGIKLNVYVGEQRVKGERAVFVATEHDGSQWVSLEDYNKVFENDPQK